MAPVSRMVYIEGPCNRNVIPPPLWDTLPPLEGYFRGEDVNIWPRKNDYMQPLCCGDSLISEDCTYDSGQSAWERGRKLEIPENGQERP